MYDLTVSKNLEEEEAPRFAAKLDELVPACDVDEFGAPAGGAEEEEFTGSFLETGVSFVVVIAVVVVGGGVNDDDVVDDVVGCGIVVVAVCC